MAWKDVQQALRFLRKNKDRFRIDTARVAAHGEFYGWLFAAALGVVGVTDRGGNSDAYSQRVGIVSDWFGRTDFTLPKSQPIGKPCHEYWLGILDGKMQPLFNRRASCPTSTTIAPAAFRSCTATMTPRRNPVHSVKLANGCGALAGIRPKLYMNQGYGHDFTGATHWSVDPNLSHQRVQRRSCHQGESFKAPSNPRWPDRHAVRSRGASWPWKTHRYVDGNGSGNVLLITGVATGRSPTPIRRCHSSSACRLRKDVWLQDPGHQRRYILISACTLP